MGYEQLLSALKHLPGKHDQASHGKGHGTGGTTGERGAGTFPSVPTGFTYNASSNSLEVGGQYNNTAKVPHKVRIYENGSGHNAWYSVHVVMGDMSDAEPGAYSFDRAVKYSRKLAAREYFQKFSSNYPQGNYKVHRALKRPVD